MVFEIGNALLNSYAKWKYTEGENRGRLPWSDIGTLPEHPGEVACTCGRWAISSQGCCLSTFRSYGNQGRSQWLKENNCYDHLQEEQKRRSRSASPQFLVRPWNNPFSKPFLATWSTRLLWMASMDSVRAYHAWLTLLLPAMRWMAPWMRETVDIVYLDFSKAMVFCSVPTAKVTSFCLGK